MIKQLLTLAVILLFVVAPVCWGANAQVTTIEHYIGASVDTDPGASGYGTVEIRPITKNNRGLISFSVRGGTGTVDLQFHDGDENWQTEGQYTAGDCKNIEDPSDSRIWKAIVLDNNQGTGTTYFGFSWSEGPKY